MDRKANTVFDLSLDTSPLWNGEEAPQITLLRERMRIEYNLDKMTNKRVHRLCNAAGITLEQLCGMAGVFGKQRVKALHNQAAKREQAARDEHRSYITCGNRYMRKPPRPKWIWPWEIALHFARIEKFYFEQKILCPTTLGPEDIHLTKAMNS